MKNYLMSFRKKFLNSFNKETNYQYDRLSSMTYNGDGFYVNRVDMGGIEKMWSYDINWAYGAALINNTYPLSTEYSNEPTDCAIYACKVVGRLDRRYKEFNYHIYENKLFHVGDDVYMILISNIDYEIFRDMYTNEIEIYKEYYYKDVGSLPIKTQELVNKLYQMKRGSDKECKKLFEISIYGLNAKKLDRKGYFNQIEFCNAYAETQYEGIRDKRVPIALFQTAYTRYEMWSKFKLYKEYIKYMNTDAIYSTHKLDIPTEEGVLGKYKLEINGNKVQFVRRNFYVVYNDDGSIKKITVDGIVDKETITLEELNELHKGNTIIKHSYGIKDKIKQLVERKVTPLFNQRLYGGKQ